MKTNIKIETYKDYRLMSEVIRCGIGGDIWKITVLRKDGTQLGTYSDDAYCVAERRAKDSVHKDIMNLATQ